MILRRSTTILVNNLFWLESKAIQTFLEPRIYKLAVYEQKEDPINLDPINPNNFKLKDLLDPKKVNPKPDAINEFKSPPSKQNTLPSPDVVN